MMGDNRDNSTDSRVLSQVGYVPFENLVGTRPDHLLLDPRRRARLAGVALAMVGSLGSPVLDRSMSRAPKVKIAPDISPAPPTDGGEPIDLAAFAASPEAKEKKRRRRGTAAFEDRIGYRFKNAALLEQALTHISALTGVAQPRRLLPAAGIPRRPRARPGHLRHAVPRLSEGRRGRDVAPPRRPGAQGDLRRRGARDRSRAGHPARHVREQCRRPQPHRHPGRRLRGADRRGVHRRRLRGGRRR